MTMAHKLSLVLALLGTCALLGVSACGSEAPAGSSSSGKPSNELSPGDGVVPNHTALTGSQPDDTEGAVGSIALSLKLGDKQLDSMNYAIVGSGFSKSGSLDVSHSSKVSGIVGGIPFGSNYALTMNGKGVGDAPLDCSGSTSFDLNNVGPLSVSIQITCKEPAVVVEPPPTPAPVPPFAIITLACALAAVGVLAQRRPARS